MPSKTRTFLAPPKPADKAAQAEALLDGRYRIDRLLGEGGMGAVYLASHVGLGRQVAIKFLHADLISREEFVGRFYREAQAAAAIRHKNIIEVFDVGMSPKGEPFLVMEYLEGESLAGLLTEKPEREERGRSWVLSGPNPFPSDLRVLRALCVKQLATPHWIAFPWSARVVALPQSRQELGYRQDVDAVLRATGAGLGANADELLV